MKKCYNCGCILDDKEKECLLCKNNKINGDIRLFDISTKEDLSFKILNASSYNCDFIDVSLRHKKALLIVGLIFLISGIFSLFSTVVAYIIFNNPDFDIPSGFFIPFFIGSAMFVLFGALIIALYFRSKKYIKQMRSNGIIIKNLPYTIQHDLLTDINVVAHYVDNNGKRYYFSGQLNKGSVKEENVCDVIFNPDKPNYYFLKERI